MANTQTPESIFLTQRRPLLRLAQAWLRGPNEQAVGVIRDYRRFFAEHFVKKGVEAAHACLASIAAPNEISAAI